MYRMYYIVNCYNYIILKNKVAFNSLSGIHDSLHGSRVHRDKIKKQYTF